MNIKRYLIPFVAGITALTFACGGGPEKVDADDWVDDLCEATGDLADAEFDAFDDYDAAYDESDADDGDAIRDALLQYVEDYNDALDDFEDELGNIGEPDVRDGNKVLEAVRQFIDDERESLKDMEEDVKDLDEDGEELALAVDDAFFSIEFADLLELIEDSDARDGDDVIELIDEDEDCASYLFRD